MCSENEGKTCHPPGLNGGGCQGSSHRLCQESVFTPDFQLKKEGKQNKSLYNQLYIAQYSSVPGPLKPL